MNLNTKTNCKLSILILNCRIVLYTHDNVFICLNVFISVEYYFLNDVCTIANYFLFFSRFQFNIWIF